MGSYRTGGLIGKRLVPNADSASGVWSIGEVYAAQKDGIWPVVFASPTSLSGLELWLDSSDSDTLYDATTGGNLVNVDGTVARWEDKSGNSRHFTQSDTGRRPTRKSNVKNSLDSIAFANDWMTGVYTYSAATIFVVWEHPTTVSGDTFPSVFGSRTASSNKTTNSSLNYNIMLPSASLVAVDPSESGGTYRLNGSAASSNFNSFSTGVNVKTSPDRWQYTSASFTSVSGSKAFTIGADPFTASARMMQDGHVAEVIVYSVQLSASVVSLVESYLATKWGL
jgi:hypothetical protein